MKETYKQWEIAQGKGSRFYLRLLDEENTMHPDDINDINGLGTYNFDILKNLAIGILRMEKALFEETNILKKASSKLCPRCGSDLLEREEYFACSGMNNEKCDYYEEKL